MDDIYGDLENYEDVNAVAELRSENMELKSKLQEYTTNMAKLQKDLETLTTDYKKLEQNYSSLLKTAKSEIERKTQMISTLNIEKDMMVIDLVKNGINRNAHNLIRSSVKDKSHTTENKSSDNPKKNYSNTKVKDIPEKQKTDIIFNKEQERHDKNTNSSLDKVSKIPNNENSRINHTNVRDNSSKMKDNTPYKLDSVVKPQALSITNRRKSMPAVRVDNPKFSEDEDTHTDKRNFSTKQTHEKKSAQKNYDEKYSSRKSDASSVEDRNFGYRDSTRDSYKSRSSRYYNQKPRSRDRYETPQYRKHYSPDRTRRSKREFYEGHNVSPDYGRRRVTDSPPAEQYSQHRSRDHRPNYERSQPYYQYDRSRDSYQDKQIHATKHKISIGYDEPSSKRYKAHDRHSKESDRSKMDSDNLWHDGREFFIKESAFDPRNDVKYISCQSPDYDHTDASNHEMKEIKSTATEQIEDPRVNSKTYSIKKTEDGKEVLSTVFGGNVDIKHIDKSIWNLRHLYLPDALLKNPSEMSDSIVNDIYKDAHNPEVIIPLELDASEKNPNDKKQVDSQEKYDNCDSSSIIPPIQSFPSKSVNQISPTLKLEKCRIPKHNQHNKDGPNQKIDKCSKKSVYTCKDKNTVEITSQEQKSKVDEYSKPNKIFSDTGKSVTILPRKDNLKNDLKTYSNLRLSNDIVAGDLELSDETNDNADVHKQYVKKESKSKTPERKSKKRESSNVDKYSKGHKSTKSDTESNKHQTINRIDPDKSQRDLTEDKCKNLKDHKSDTGKTPKSKKKSRHKDAIKESPPTIDNAQSTDKSKSKKEKESITSPVSNKFSDLFGDSNSLITPEDLGIHPVPTMSQTQYVPIFEDAQDAIDINTKNNDPKIELPKSCKEITDGDNTIISSKKEEMEPYYVDSSKNKNVTKKHENFIVPVEVISNIIPAENIVMTSGKDTDVVKTVIISRGVQPQNVMSSIEVPENSLTEPITREPSEGIKQINQTPLKALATSTPHKLVNNVLQVNMEGKNPVSSCNSSETATTQSMYQSDSNTLDTQDADIPDVRIFVRRRRKVIKKS